MALSSVVLPAPFGPMMALIRQRLQAAKGQRNAVNFHERPATLCAFMSL
jgi:hypothetical protein